MNSNHQTPVTENGETVTSNKFAMDREPTATVPRVDGVTQIDVTRGNGPLPIDVRRHPPRVFFGQIFKAVEAEGMIILSRPDPVEMKRSAELAYGLRQLTAQHLKLEATELEVVFGMATCGTATSMQYCFTVKVPGWNTIDPVLIGNLQRSIPYYIQEIAGKKNDRQDDLDLPPINEQVSQLIGVAANDHRANFGDSRLPGGITVGVAEERFKAPRKIGQRPPVEERIETKCIKGRVEMLAHTPRETKIKPDSGKAITAKFDILAHAPKLCRQFLDRAKCETKIELHVARDGKETIILLESEELQLRFPEV